MKNEIKIEDYSKTLNLPKETILTNGDVVKREGFFLNKMQASNRYRDIIEKNKNGKIVYNIIENPMILEKKLNSTYIQNKILKDIIIRYEILMGCIVNHNIDFMIPDEKIKEIKKSGIKGEELKKLYNQKMEELNNYARENIQKIKKLGTVIDYNSLNTPTLKINYAQILINKFWEWYQKNKIFTDVKSEYWCSKCGIKKVGQSVVLKKETVDNLYVLYKVQQGNLKNKNLISKIENSSNVYIITNTTLPWKIAFSDYLAVVENLEYSIIKVNEKDEDIYYIVKSSKAEDIMQAAFYIRYNIINKVKGKDLVNIVCNNPLDEKRSIEVISSKEEYVILDKEADTGISIVSPGNTPIDYKIAKDNKKVEIKDVIDKTGKIKNKIGKYVGMHCNEVSKEVINNLNENKKILISEKANVKVEHCKECDSELIYINQKEWCIKKSYKDEELNKIYNTLSSKISETSGHKYIENELLADVSKKDVIISDRRPFGIPLPIVYCAECSNEIINEELVNALNNFFRNKNISDYYNLTLDEILNSQVHCDKCGGTSLYKGNVTFNEIFKNICISNFNDIKVINNKKNVNIAIENKEEFLKLIKSLSYGDKLDSINNINKIMLHSNVVYKKYKDKEPILPDEVIKKYGTDVLRLWCAMHANDHTIYLNEPDIIYTNKMYRKIRRTFKFIISNLSDFNPLRDMVVTSDCNDLDQYIYTKLVDVIKKVEFSYSNIDISNVYKTIIVFCENDLCKYYFDSVKFRMYILNPDNKLRRSTQSMLYKILATLVRYLTPILPITLEEIWPFVWHRNLQEESNIMLYRGRVNVIENDFKNVIYKWKNIFKMKDDIKKYIDLAISKKKISKSLEAKVIIRQKNSVTVDFIKKYKEDILRTLNISQIEEELSNSNSIIVTKADGLECERCKNYSRYLGQNIKYKELCPICSEIIENRKV